MRRNILLTGLCTMLIGVSSLITQAQRIVVNVDANKPGMPVSLNIKDAEVGQVLTTLFNQTNNKYNVQLEAGVTGNIDTLQLAQMPFDEALTTILGSVKDAPAKYTFTKDGNNLYRVASGVASGIESTPTKTGVIKHPNGENIPFIKAMLPPVQNPLTAESTDPNTPSAKECILAMITLKNIPVFDFSKDLGGDCIESYETDNGNGNGGGGSRSSRSSRNNNNDDNYTYDQNGNRIYDNNNNNNNYNDNYNDNNNNNNNNSDYYIDSEGRRVRRN